jgi:hypothetical protein
MFCEFCQALIAQPSKSGRFCNKSCSSKFALKDVDRKKASKKGGQTYSERYSYKLPAEDDQILMEFERTKSFTRTLRALGCATHCGARNSLRKRLEMLGVDVSVTNRRRFVDAQGNLIYDEIFKKHEKKQSTHPIIKGMLEMGVDYRCAWCGIGNEWNGKSLTLQIDHINGDNSDNRIQNLRFLCPNCHSQTETWCSKNMKRKFR